MKRSIGRSFAIGMLAVAGMLTIGAGIGNADTTETDGSYPTGEACRDAGADVMAATPGNWNTFWCIPEGTAANNWRLVLGN